MCSVNVLLRPVTVKSSRKPLLQRNKSFGHLSPHSQARVSHIWRPLLWSKSCFALTMPCVDLCAGLRAPWHTRGSQRTASGSLVSFHHVRSRNWTQVARYDGRHLTCRAMSPASNVNFWCYIAKRVNLHFWPGILRLIRKGRWENHMLKEQPLQAWNTDMIISFGSQHGFQLFSLLLTPLQKITTTRAWFMVGDTDVTEGWPKLSRQW